jgi:hypothetical protein
VVCYKDPGRDPIQGPTTTINFRNAPVNRPEQSLIGVQFSSQVAWGNNVDYIVTNSGNWVYTGTGFNDGDAVHGLTGYEMDRLMSNYAVPSVLSQTLLSNSPFVNTGGQSDYANSSIYQAPGGAWVFAAGTSSWNLALDSWGSSIVDPRIQQTMANIMNGFATASAPGTSPSLIPPLALPSLPSGIGQTPAMATALQSSKTAMGLGID